VSEEQRGTRDGKGGGQTERNKRMALCCLGFCFALLPLCTSYLPPLPAEDWNTSAVKPSQPAKEKALA
jgi:hypothetical protein